VLADRAYDTNKIIEMLGVNNIIPVIPPKKNRKVQRTYSKELYKKRHRIENFFLYLRKWRGIATRYCKNISSFLAAVHIRCFTLIVEGI
jgi:transposase